MTDREQPPLELPVGQYLTAEISEADRERLWAKIRARQAARGRLSEHGASAPLPLPIAQSLLQDEELSAARARVWRAVLARVQRPRPRSSRAFLAFAGLLSVAACALLALQLPGSWRPAARAPKPGAALLRADGAALGLMEASEQTQIVRLSDASEIRLARGARLEPLQSSGTRFEVLLARGSAEFSVTPGGPRRWLVEAGAARVEVVGTVFRVERSTDEVLVSVSRGAVLVRGESVPGWVQRVSAGERLRVASRPGAQAEPAQVAEPAASASAAPPSVEQIAPLEAPAAGAELAQPDAEKAKTPRPSARSGSGPHAAAARLNAGPQERYAALGPQGMARETAAAGSIEVLLQLADIARLSGHPRDAVAPLTRALLAFRASPQAALAAFTLGRVQLDQLDQPRAAADAFERAIALRLPRALLPDCYRRLSEAYARAGDSAARERAEQRFRTAFEDSSGADSQRAIDARESERGSAPERAQPLQEVGGAAP